MGRISDFGSDDDDHLKRILDAWENDPDQDYAKILQKRDFYDIISDSRTNVDHIFNFVERTRKPDQTHHEAMEAALRAIELEYIKRQGRK